MVPTPAAIPAIAPVEMLAPVFDVGEDAEELSEGGDRVVSKGTTFQVEFQLCIHISSLEVGASVTGLGVKSGTHTRKVGLSSRDEWSRQVEIKKCKSGLLVSQK
ncbi:hypothetical protein TWF106_009240 [Orbilia oligospora]|uniref:Uncharacterized protein n=1 Tax=Orbilia oligospora TaxID=2813651 RepID=A0A7C8V8S0_ORBOL|nr:hypothetical protein TWF106_009240 [Orbilia oligospora]